MVQTQGSIIKLGNYIQRYFSRKKSEGIQEIKSKRLPFQNPNITFLVILWEPLKYVIKM